MSTNPPTTSELITKCRQQIVETRERISMAKAHLVELSILRKNWQRTVIPLSFSSDRTDHSITGNLEIKWAFTDMYGNNKEMSESKLMQEYLRKTFFNDPVLFERFLTQYTSHVNCAIVEYERKVDKLIQEGKDLFNRF